MELRAYILTQLVLQVRVEEVYRIFQIELPQIGVIKQFLHQIYFKESTCRKV